MNISFKVDDYKFNYRVAAIIKHDDRYLIQKADKDSYYSLVGGRVEIGENSIFSIKRELEEEIGLIVKDSELKLINISENFFQHEEKKFHEMLFIFKIELKDEVVTKKDDFKMLDKETSTLKWFTKDQIKDMNLQPRLAKDLLETDTLTHKIIND